MKIVILLCLLPLSLAGPALPFGPPNILSFDGCGERKCKQNEGDCDSDDDCVEGLICDFDGWWGRDYCKAGPKTKNFQIGDWGEWSECSAEECGVWGTRNRSRSCTPPEFGGYECPSEENGSGFRYWQIDGCKGKCSKVACNYMTWDKFAWDCCTAAEPCYEEEGDCDNDAECAGDLVCGKNNCPAGFTAKFGKNKPDCCEKPQPVVERGVFSHDGCKTLDGQTAKCKQGEGDCDSDEDCVDGLVCDYDNWWGQDYCIAGPNTKNGKVSEWGEWSECSVQECGTIEMGTQSRLRTCIEPEFGGYPCPKDTEWTQYKACSAPPCPTTTQAPTTMTVEAKPQSKAACNPATWQKFAWNCCTAKEPCYEAEGDCDNDDECAGDLVCGKNNCPDGFKARSFGNKPDCCKKPQGN